MKFEDFFIDPVWDEAIKEQYSRYYKEIWNDHEYDRHGLTIAPGDVVVDCGASIGIFSRYALFCGASKVISIEADLDVFEYLQRNCAKTNAHSVHGMVRTEMGANSYDLDRILNDFNLHIVDFMKVDIEGREYEFILEAPDNLLKRVRKWSIELHVWSIFSNHADELLKCMEIMEKLTRCGFKFSVEKIHKNTCLYMLYGSR